MNLFETEKRKGKTVPIEPKQILAAWRKVKSNGGSHGVDGKTISKINQRLGDELHQLWSRMASGSYHPQPVRAVSIPKKDGSSRLLGIPTVCDRVAQQVIKDLLESELEKVFHTDSYGYRPYKSAHQAIEKCNKRCWEKRWVIGLDIKGFFDNLDHELLIKALKYHSNQKWVIMYIERWLKAPIKHPDKKALEKREKGTPQGGVISPLLANLFLHYAFDKWMTIHYPLIKFERYADDIVIHCNSQTEAERVMKAVKVRMEECKLTLHPNKSKVVYCKQGRQRGDFSTVSFDFLGYTFQPRKVKYKNGLYGLGYGPAISNKAQKHIVRTFRNLKIHRWTTKDLESISLALTSQIRGWINYFSKYRKWSMYSVFRQLNDRLVKWLMNKYKRYRRRKVLARRKLKLIANEYPNLFIHWQHGF
ncbi:MAG: group II intron reverse transcriptase/maturase, partial [Bacteroidota bacterium]